LGIGIGVPSRLTFLCHYYPNNGDDNRHNSNGNARRDSNLGVIGNASTIGITGRAGCPYYNKRGQNLENPSM
jgi:hypothetical protein